jgi:hypothetical protein
LKVSRLEPDAVGANHRLLSRAALRPSSRRQGVVRSSLLPPRLGTLHDHSGRACGRNAGVTVAEVNLKLIWDVISGIR